MFFSFECMSKRISKLSPSVVFMFCIASQLLWNRGCTEIEVVQSYIYILNNKHLGIWLDCSCKFEPKQHTKMKMGVFIIKHVFLLRKGKSISNRVKPKFGVFKLLVLFNPKIFISLLHQKTFQQILTIGELELGYVWLFFPCKNPLTDLKNF